MSEQKLNMRNFVNSIRHDLMNDDKCLPQILDKVYEHLGEDPAIKLIADILERYQYNLTSREEALEELRRMLFD